MAISFGSVVCVRAIVSERMSDILCAMSQSSTSPKSILNEFIRSFISFVPHKYVPNAIFQVQSHLSYGFCHPLLSTLA